MPVPTAALDCRSAWTRMSVDFIRKFCGKGKKACVRGARRVKVEGCVCLFLMTRTLFQSQC